MIKNKYLCSMWIFALLLVIGIFIALYFDNVNTYERNTYLNVIILFSIVLLLTIVSILVTKVKESTRQQHLEQLDNIRDRERIYQQYIV